MFDLSNVGDGEDFTILPSNYVLLSAIFVSFKAIDLSNLNLLLYQINSQII